MADFRAIAAVSEAVLQLLLSNYREDDFNRKSWSSVSSTAHNFTDPPSAGVSDPTWKAGMPEPTFEELAALINGRVPHARNSGPDFTSGGSA